VHGSLAHHGRDIMHSKENAIKFLSYGFYRLVPSCLANLGGRKIQFSPERPCTSKYPIWRNRQATGVSYIRRATWNVPRNKSSFSGGVGKGRTLYGRDYDVGYRGTRRH